MLNFYHSYSSTWSISAPLYLLFLLMLLWLFVLLSFFFYCIRLAGGNKHYFSVKTKHSTFINTTLHKLDEFMHPVQRREEVTSRLQPVHLWHLVPWTCTHHRNYLFCILGGMHNKYQLAEYTLHRSHSHAEHLRYSINWSENVSLCSQGQWWGW